MKAATAIKPVKNNCLGRVHAVLLKAESIREGEGAPAVRLWGRALDLEEPTDEEMYATVALALCQLVAELDRGTQLLIEQGANPQTFTRQLKKIRVGISPSALTTQWKRTRESLLRTELLDLLGALADRLPEDHQLIPAEELAEISSLLDQLEESLKDNNLPAHLLDFLQRETEIMRRALHDYPIQGIEALRNAVESAVGKWMLTNPSTDVEQVRSLSAVLGRTLGLIFRYAPHFKALVDVAKMLLLPSSDHH